MSGNSSNLNLNATNQQNIVLNQQNLINRGNIIVNQTQNTQNLILNQTNIMQNSQNIILNHASPQNIVLSQNNLLSRPPSVQSQKQSPHPSPCQSPYQIFNTNTTMVGSNNLSLISNFPQNTNAFSANFHHHHHHHQTNIIQQQHQQQSHNIPPPGGGAGGGSSKGMSPSLNITSVQSSQTVQQISGSTKLNQQLSSNNSTSYNSTNYSNPSPISNPLNSPYSNQILSPSSVSSVTLKSPVQSPSPILRPATPQPQLLQQTFQQLPVMTSGPNQLVQIIQAPNNGQPFQNHQIINRQSIIAPNHQIQNQAQMVKIKHPLNILPKPPNQGMAGTNATNNNNKSSPRNSNQSPIGSNQNNQTPIVLPNQTILPQGQAGTLLLNQMPLLVQQNTPQGIQLVLRPGTPNNAQQIGNQRTGNLILQQGNANQTPTVLIQHNSRPTTIQQPQQLVRVLTANGMIQQLATTPTFIMNGQPINLQQLSQQKSSTPQIINQTQQNINIQAQNMATLQACIPNLQQIVQQQIPQQIQQQQIQMQPPTQPMSGNATQIINAVATNTTNVTNALNNQQIPGDVIKVIQQQLSDGSTTEQGFQAPKKKPKKKKAKIKETKLDLANLMKLSGIGDDDDMYMEGENIPETSQSGGTPEQKPFLALAKSPPTRPTIQTPKQSPQPEFPQMLNQNTIQKLQSQEFTLTQNEISNLISFPSQIGSIQISAITDNQTKKTVQNPQGLNVVREINPSITTIPSQIGNIQISQICTPQQQNNTNFGTSQPGIIVQNTQPQNTGGMQNLASTLQGLATSGSGQSQQQPPLGGFKLAMSEDGRILLQHDPSLHQDLQSQLLLQHIFGLVPQQNVQPNVQPNIVFTSNPQVISTQAMNITPQISQKQFEQHQKCNSTKTINSMQQSIATPKIENNLLFNEPLVLAPSGINGQLMLSLSSEHLEQLKNSNQPQFNLNGPTLLVQQQQGQHQPQQVMQSPRASPFQIKTNVLTQQNVNKTSEVVTKPVASSPSPKSKLVKKTKTTPVQTFNVVKNLNKCNKTEHKNIIGTNTTSSPPSSTVQTISNNSNNVNTSIGAGLISPPRCHTSSAIINLDPSISSSNNNISPVIHTSSPIIDSSSPIIYSSSPMIIHSSTPISSSPVFSNAQMVFTSSAGIQSLKVSNSGEIIPNSVMTSAPVSSVGGNVPQLIPIPHSSGALITGVPPQGPFQRVQTIQLTPQKQQQLKSVQQQIQALNSRLQSKLSDPKPMDYRNNEMTDTEIQIALQKLFSEQQKILATGKLLPNLPAQAIPAVFPGANVGPKLHEVVASQPATTIQYMLPEPVQSISSLNSGQTTTKTTSINHFSPNMISQHSPLNRSQVSSSSQAHPSTTNKVYYHHMGNQVIQITPSPQSHSVSRIVTSSIQSTSVNSPITSTNVIISSMPSSIHKPITTISPTPQTVNNNNNKPLIPITVQTQLPDKTIQVGTQTIQENVSPRFVSSNSYNNIPKQMPVVPNNLRSIKTMMSPTPVAPTPPPPPPRPQISRPALFEQQLTMDQQEAADPDIHTPFASKADACKRLVRYHCFNQPVLSQKDLNKADEIFELTARHFIDKFYNMVNKYKTLRLMDSMREVPTSELMMIDRMFIGGEQQELEQLRAEKLQRDLEDSGCDITNLIKHEDLQSTSLYLPELKTEYKNTFKQEIKSEINTDYDEWLCIQKELGYNKTEIKLESPKYEIKSDNKRSLSSDHPVKRVCTDYSTKLSESEVYRTPPKNNLSSDLELELDLLKSDSFDENIDAQVQSAIDSILNLQQNQDGSINMNAIISQQSASASDDKNAQFFNDLLGVGSNHRKVTMDSLKRKVNDLYHEDTPDIIFRDVKQQQRLLSQQLTQEVHLSDNTVDSFSECSSPDDALDQAVRSILS